MKKSISKLIKIFILASFVMLNLTCDKDKEFYFPYVQVDMQLGLYTDLIDLGNINTKVYNGEGVGGIVILKVNDSEFYAFDLACTHEIQDEVCIIKEHENSEIIYKCPCCGSQFTLDISGIAYISNDGPAKHPLKNYRTFLDHAYLYVTN